MRKHQQKQLLELIKTLHEANNEIKRLYMNKNIQKLIDFLTECQNSTVQIGEFIEHIEGEGTKTVSYLEEYYELLYQLSIKSCDTSSGSGIFKQLQKLLVKIENCIRTELKPNKIEMVFLPYKASMWDSMESVWLSAANDPQCDAYVVPIPYYDKLPNGESGQIHYEGNQYPDYVPIVDWQGYNIEERRPEVVVVHNPYDEGNYVTSVHQDFYCKRLKNLTDLLVYIPYFVCIDDVEEEFCVCAGTLYADRVIVQSEKVRQTYIRFFQGFEKTNNCKGRFGDAETKFVALGSPKFDKVINSRPEDFTLPDEWQRLIEKPDGTKKKAVLYNTSISAMLLGNDAYLKKIRDVLDVFRNRDDTVLWWRPHPLHEVTYQSMRPQFLGEYEQIIAEYKREGWGIYDDTADLHRSICLTSCYFGDGGSLVALYQYSGKPVMRQNQACVKITTEKTTLLNNTNYDDAGERLVMSTERPRFSAFDFVGDKIFLYCAENDALYSLDRANGETMLEAVLPNGSAGGHGYIHLVNVRNRLYFAPWIAANIASYDLANKSIDEYPLRDLSNDRRANMRYICVYNDNVFFVPYEGTSLVYIDLATDKTVHCKDWLTGFEKKKDACMRASGLPMQDGSLLFIPYQNPNGVIEFDCKTKRSVALHPIHDCVRIVSDGDVYWWINSSGVLSKWNYKTGHTAAFHDFKEDLALQKPPEKLTYLLACSKGFILLFPHHYHAGICQKVFKVDIKSGAISSIDALEVSCNTNSTMSPNSFCYYQAEVFEDGYTYAYSNIKKALLRIDPRTDEIKEIPIIINTDNIAEFRLREKGLLIETESYTLAAYIECIYDRNSLLNLGKSDADRETFLAIGRMLAKYSAYNKNRTADLCVYASKRSCGAIIMDYILSKCGVLK